MKKHDSLFWIKHQTYRCLSFDRYLFHVTKVDALVELVSPSERTETIPKRQLWKYFGTPGHGSVGLLP